MSLDIAVPAPPGDDYTAENTQVLRDAATTSASGRTSTSATPVRAACTTSSTSSSTTPSTRPSPGICKNIHVTILPDGGLSVADDGRGIPVEEHPTEQKSTLEVVMTIVGAGGKFDNKAYKSSAGLHGMGAKAVTALSEWTEAEVRRNGRLYQMEFERGDAIEAARGHRPGHPHRHQDHLQAGPGDLRRRHVRLRHARKPAARAGLPQQGAGHHAERRADGQAKETTSSTRAASPSSSPG